MKKPVSPQHGVTFNLAAVAQELRSEPSYQRDGHIARTLVRTPDQRVVLIVLEGGRRMSQHQAEATASIQTISGNIRLQLPDRPVDLAAGELLVLGHGLEHDVEAQDESAFLLTLGWRD